MKGFPDAKNIVNEKGVNENNILTSENRIGGCDVMPSQGMCAGTSY